MERKHRVRIAMWQYNLRLINKKLHLKMGKNIYLIKNGFIKPFFLLQVLVKLQFIM